MNTVASTRPASAHLGGPPSLCVTKEGERQEPATLPGEGGKQLSSSLAVNTTALAELVAVAAKGIRLAAKAYLQPVGYNDPIGLHRSTCGQSL